MARTSPTGGASRAIAFRAGAVADRGRFGTVAALVVRAFRVGGGAGRAGVSRRWRRWSCGFRIGVGVTLGGGLSTIARAFRIGAGVPSPGDGLGVIKPTYRLPGYKSEMSG
ncbi:hypothetical protein [Dactylosporangium sp. CS-033363]|uniref:hypothetical protein n=1 Tax=Dactylosporangium sp. CS-033363 TaxID=3239935 RepID=UPI003D9121B1